MKRRWQTLAGILSLAAAVTAAFPAFSEEMNRAGGNPAGIIYQENEGGPASQIVVRDMASGLPDGPAAEAAANRETAGDRGAEESRAFSGEEIRDISRDGVQDVLVMRAGKVEAGQESFKELNDPVHGNEGLMRNTHSGEHSFENDWEALQQLYIPSFLEKYRVMSYTTNVEKELAIITGLIRESTYRVPENQEDLSYYTAYSCLAGHYAQCAGYADAFLQIVRAAMPGTDVRYIHSDTHAWNLLKLGDSWYHVDVTWEDDDRSGELINRFINLEDCEAESFKYHRWDREDTGEPAVRAAEGRAFGPLSVEYYLSTGNIEETPAEAVLPAGGSLNAEVLRDFIWQTASRAASEGRHLAPVTIFGLDAKENREALREIMSEMPHLLGRSVRYAIAPKFGYRETGIPAPEGTQILLELP